MVKKKEKGEKLKKVQIPTKFQNKKEGGGY